MARDTITFLTTGGPRVGLGHLRRCMMLGRELTQRGATVELWLSGEQGGAELCRSGGLLATWLGDAPDAGVAALAGDPRATVVVDDYAMKATHFDALRGVTDTVAVIDDLADRTMNVDLAINASPEAASLPYRVPSGCTRLFGPRFALLGTAFRHLAPRRVSSSIERVLITLGGGDPRGQTPAVVRAVRAALPEAHLDVVLGPLFGEMRLPSDAACTIHRAPADGLQPLMVAVDLAVTGGGQTTYELAACGLPALALCLADNQRGNLTHLAAAGTLLVADDDHAGLEVTLRRLAEDAVLRQRMSVAGQALVDGLGAGRVADSLLTLSKARERTHA